MSLEHHKDLYDHWSDDDYDSLTDEDEAVEAELEAEYANYIRNLNKRYEEYGLKRKNNRVGTERSILLM